MQRPEGPLLLRQSFLLAWYSLIRPESPKDPPASTVLWWDDKHMLPHPAVSCGVWGSNSSLFASRASILLTELSP